MAKVGITETVLRDAQQSLIATRMKTEDMLPIIDKMDKIGYHSIEAWGGATFDAAMRFLNEDPWHRLREIRKAAKNTKLQMLLRGQNLLGYRNYADDVVEYFVQKAIANGIDIIRIFDALNDTRNMETAIKACKKEGGHAQGAVCYTISPVHSIHHFVECAEHLVELGVDSICIKDMAGMLTPFTAYELIKSIRETVKVPLQLHMHSTCGFAAMSYLKAIEAGVDIVDCAISPMSMGTSQPPTEPTVAALKGTPYDTGLDLSQLSGITEYFKPLKEKYFKSGLLETNIMAVDVNTLTSQIPGGMLSNLVTQLKQSEALDKYEEVLKEIPRVREDFGYPPLVTPTSQIICTQAVFNVLTGERYKMVPKESINLVAGKYGKTPAPISEEIVKKILEEEKPITCRPADLLGNELDKIRNKIKDYIEQEEDVLSYALLPQAAEKLFKARKVAKTAPKEENEDELIAVISAAIAAMETKPEHKLVVKSFRRMHQTNAAWSSRGRIERLRGFM